jgi:hypothetical protein
MVGIAVAVGIFGVWFGGVRDASVILGIGTFSLASLAGLGWATRNVVGATVERAAA